MPRAPERSALFCSTRWGESPVVYATKPVTKPRPKSKKPAASRRSENAFIGISLGKCSGSLPKSVVALKTLVSSSRHVAPFAFNRAMHFRTSARFFVEVIQAGSRDAKLRLMFGWRDRSDADR